MSIANGGLSHTDKAGGLRPGRMPTRAPPAFGNPRRLARILDSVGAGVRRPASIARVLDLEVRLVRTYLSHAAWLGLLRDPLEPQLTQAGLALVYAGPRRLGALAAALSAHPLLGQSPLPTVDTVAAALLDAGVSTSEPTARRDARAMLRLAEPARKMKPRVPPAEQMTLGFAGAIESRPLLYDPEPGDDSLDVYAIVLRGLMENGELRLNTLRGLMDSAGAQNAGLGSYVALAVRRADAERRGDHLVVTPGAVARADLAESVVSIALSDPDFRAWLAQAPVAASEARRCARWARRLFGAEPAATALPRLLFGRALETVPAAGEGGGSLPATRGAFLDVLGEPGLVLAFPETLAQLSGGITWVHKQWRSVVQNPAGVRPPSPLDVRTGVHAGLLSPGETPPRNIPDALSLRLRAMRAVPAFALLVAAGMLHRRKVIRIRMRGNTVIIEAPERRECPWGLVLARVARARGWTLCPTLAPPRWRELLHTAADLGLMVRLPGDAWTIDETLAWRLDHDAEHHELHDRLLPLCDVLEAACAP